MHFSMSLPHTMTEKAHSEVALHLIVNPEALAITKAECDALFDEFTHYIRDVLSIRDIKEEVRSGKNPSNRTYQTPTENRR